MKGGCFKGSSYPSDIKREKDNELALAGAFMPLSSTCSMFVDS
jgi:hypothetical protein